MFQGIIGVLIAFAIILLCVYIIYGGGAPPTGGEEDPPPPSGPPSGEPEGDLPTGGGGSEPDFEIIDPTEAINQDILEQQQEDDTDTPSPVPYRKCILELT